MQPEPPASPDPVVSRRGFAFGFGAVAGTAGGLIGLGGAEFRLPALVGALGFTARQAVPLNLAASFAVLAAAFPFRLGCLSPATFEDRNAHAPVKTTD